MNFSRRQILTGVAALGVSAASTTLGSMAHAATKVATKVATEVATKSAVSTGVAAATADAGGLLDVIVLGAGMAGLNAAWLLQQEGLKVLTLEARQRVGGRVYTLLDQPGYPEMGFNLMAAGYGRGINAARRAGVELEDVLPRLRADTGRERQLVLNGRTITKAEWATSPYNPMPEGLRNMMPWEAVNILFARHTRLKNWLSWYQPQNAALDISVHDFLAAQGLSDAAIELVFDSSPYYGVTSHETSALMYEYNDGWVKSQPQPVGYGVKGGNMRLPMAMANMLKGDLLMGKEVIAIENADDAITVTCRDGSRFRAKRVISAMPFAALRNVKIEPLITGPQAKTIATMLYQPITLAFLTVKEPFWDKDGLSPAMFTDSTMGLTIPQHFGKKPEEITGFILHARGRLALQWDRLGPEITKRLIVEDLARYRPASKGLVKVQKIHSWAMEPFNGGDWAFFAPGQIAPMMADIAKPAGRLHFCGEHTSTGSRGLEGALESSERVVVEVLDAIA